MDENESGEAAAPDDSPKRSRGPHPHTDDDPAQYRQLIDSFVQGLGPPPPQGDQAAIAAAIAKFQAAPQFDGCQRMVLTNDPDTEDLICRLWLIGCWFCIQPDHDGQIWQVG